MDAPAIRAAKNLYRWRRGQRDETLEGGKALEGVKVDRDKISFSANVDSGLPGRARAAHA
jgi:hypothetical protein